MNNDWIKKICERSGISAQVREEINLLAKEIYSLREKVAKLEAVDVSMGYAKPSEEIPKEKKKNESKNKKAH